MAVDSPEWNLWFFPEFIIYGEFHYLFQRPTWRATRSCDDCPNKIIISVQRFQVWEAARKKHCSRLVKFWKETRHVRETTFEWSSKNSWISSFVLGLDVWTIAQLSIWAIGRKKSILWQHFDAKYEDWGTSAASEIRRKRKNRNTSNLSQALRNSYAVKALPSCSWSTTYAFVRVTWMINTMYG